MSIKVCSIGCGYMAASGHGPAFLKYVKKYGDVELTACCDIDEEKALKFKNMFLFKKYYIDYKEMLTIEKPDAVCLMVPEPFTADIGEYILLRGYSLMLEKPPGLNKQETLRMIAAAKTSGAKNQVAFNRRYMPLMQKFTEIIYKDLKPGDIHNISYNLYRNGRKDVDFSTTAIHGIDAVRHIVRSDYEYIRFYYQELTEIAPGAANIFMECTMKSGAYAHLNFSPMAGVIVERAVVNAKGHTYFLNLPVWDAIDSPGGILHIEEGKKKENITGLDVCESTLMFDTNGFYEEDRSFFDDIKAQRNPSVNLQLSLQSVEIMECIRNREKEYKFL